MNEEDLDDWNNAFIDLNEQLGRLVTQLKNMEGKDFSGVIGRIEDVQSKLASMQTFIIRIKAKK